MHLVDESSDKPVTTPTITASLEHLTGPARGTVSWLSGIALDISLDDGRLIRIAEPDDEAAQDAVVARLHRFEGSYEIEARNDFPLWVNGESEVAKQLEQRDMIEFGDAGPLCRFHVHRQGSRVRKTLGDIVSDCLDYTRSSRKPRGARLIYAVRDLIGNIVREPLVLFRSGVVAALIALSAIAIYQYRANVRLQQQATSSAVQLEVFARTLTESNRDALRPADLNTLRQELDHSLSDAAQRLEQLEMRSAASTRIIADANHSIVFLQGAYGFRDKVSGRMLRLRTDEQGRQLLSLRGDPLLTLEGDGQVAERQFTGTAFLVSKNGALLTNRHVAKPWEDDTGIEEMGRQGLEPELLKFVGFLPSVDAPFPVRLLMASEDADLAVLLCSDVAEGLPYLDLGKRPLEPGDEVIVMGYPTGLKSMLGRSGDKFLEQLEQGGDLDFWVVAERLSKARLIRPLASRGIVGQLTAATVVYDAETTHGGSGGPVLDINGDVVAVNSAIIPEYGGSNFGVPVSHARSLLAAAGVNR